MSIKTYAQAIRDVIAEEMRKNDKVFIMGEDIAKQGGIFGCTRGLLDEFGSERVRNTPISEAGFVGAGIGATCAGMRPIGIDVYGFYICINGSVIKSGSKNQIHVWRKSYRSHGNQRTTGYRKREWWPAFPMRGQFFMHIPGMKVAMPSSPSDAAGLLRTAIRIITL